MLVKNKTRMIITHIYILDWYDDIITLVTLFENDVYIFNCIQKDVDNGEKIYYCVQIDEMSSQQIRGVLDKKKLTTDDWKIINLVMRA